MPQVGFEPTILVSERPKTHGLYMYPYMYIYLLNHFDKILRQHGLE
jgi:hypothetical protein